jgi:hypothetical protein
MIIADGRLGNVGEVGERTEQASTFSWPVAGNRLGCR